MATRRSDLYVPRKHRDTVEGRVIGTRLSHEHDQNDSLKARLGWHEEFNQYIKSKEKKDDLKHGKTFVNFIIWAHILMVIEFMILRFGLGVL